MFRQLTELGDVSSYFHCRFRSASELGVAKQVGTEWVESYAILDSAKRPEPLNRLSSGFVRQSPS